jgi:hypothetical protein
MQVVAECSEDERTPPPQEEEDVVVRSNSRKKRAVAVALPKNLIAHSPGKCIWQTRALEACSPNSLCRRKLGRGKVEGYTLEKKRSTHVFSARRRQSSGQGEETVSAVKDAI